MRFDTLLIANRGEIALRITRTAQRLGLRVVAIYSDADAEAPHVRAADCAVHVGASDPAKSYRNIPAILEACRRTGAGAVHPGYGFLSENAGFAEAVMAAGLTFVGPRPDVIDLMGNKARAKAAMVEAGVPTVPGILGCTSDDEVVAAARRIGFPVIFKAAAGGGGRGMRVARDEASLLGLFAQAKSEALGAFGSDEVLLEKAIERARHIEIQVLCDEHGTALHLGERDCSLQRRFQKLVEEAPSPAVTPALRAEMGEIARRACTAIGYTGVGTLEFLLGRDGAFYFMEMNTRLQVEHGVTELVTGLDLVEQQIRVAQGERLAFGQADVAWRGHAIEVRLCAENPQAGFLPQVGRVEQWRAPDGIRTDAALEDGAEVTSHYDSMLGKLLAWGETREACIATLARGCDRTVLLGVPNNLDFLSGCLRHPVFRAGGVTTDFLGSQDLDDASWRPDRSPDAEIVAVLALAGTVSSADPGTRRSFTRAFSLIVADATGRQTTWTASPLETGGWSLATGPDALSYRVDRFTWDGREAVSVIDGLRRSRAVSRISPDTVWVQDGAASLRFDRVAPSQAAGAGGPKDQRIVAPLNGKVTQMLVEPGQSVAAGQPLAIIESMKMEIPVTGSSGGIVKAVHANAGDQVALGQLLVEVSAA